MEWETVIGLEVHAQLLTKSKASRRGHEIRRRAEYAGVRGGYRATGVLPVFNKEAARMAVKFGSPSARPSITARCSRARIISIPTCPRAYQISQYELPIVPRARSRIDVDGVEKVIGNHPRASRGRCREEPARGFSRHDRHRPQPRWHAAAGNRLRARHALGEGSRGLSQESARLVRYLEVCDGNMQEGSFRCDANVSVRPRASRNSARAPELKNINSFRFVEKAIEFEVERQIDLIEGGGKVVQKRDCTTRTRTSRARCAARKEAMDYRYFPDPDLPALVLDQAFIDAVKKTCRNCRTPKRAAFHEGLRPQCLRCRRADRFARAGGLL